MALTLTASQARSFSQPLVPPEEQFWERYSPHHEAPLSGITSSVLHALILLGFWGFHWFKEKTALGGWIDSGFTPPQVDPVRLTLGGGGGDPGGKGGGPAGKGVIEEGDFLGDGDVIGGVVDPKQPPPPEHAPLDAKKVEGISTEFNNDAHVKVLVQRGTETWQSLGNLEREAREKLRRAVNPNAGSGQGQGGSGRDGGMDTGRDTGKGSGTGEGVGKLSQREKRVLRWGMTFNTTSGSDYLNQLHGLGAVLALPVNGKPGQYILVKDLQNPGGSMVEDVSSLNKIYWIDDKPESVRALYSVLLAKMPSQRAQVDTSSFVAFFPRSVEDKLLKIELAHLQQKYGARNEEKIHETKFDVIKQGDGYDVRVREIFLRR